jgi:DNA-binding transcriptional LysR family regulator
MPLHMVAPDISAGTMVILDVDDTPRTGFMLTMSAFHPASATPGPAGRRFVDYLMRAWAGGQFQGSEIL